MARPGTGLEEVSRACAQEDSYFFLIGSLGGASPSLELPGLRASFSL